MEIFIFIQVFLFLLGFQSAILIGLWIVWLSRGPKP